MKNLSMKVLMEAMNKLETEAYQDHVPGYGRGRGKSTKNWSMSTKDFAQRADTADRDDELTKAMSKMRSSEPTKKMRKPSAEDEFIRSLKVAAENLDFGDATQTIDYNMDDTEIDGASTTELVATFIDTAADSLADTLSKEKPEFQRLAPDQMEARLKSELMKVLKDMDSTDLFDRD